MGSLTNLYATTPVSEQDATKVATYNGALQILDSAVAGRLSISTTGGTTTLTGTNAAPQAQNMFFDVSGALASDAIIEMPVSATTGRSRAFYVRNGTTGNKLLTVRAVGGTGVVVPRNIIVELLYNGTDIVYPSGSIVCQRDITTSGAALSLFEVALPTLKGAAGTLSYECFAADATDVQVRRGTASWSCVNKAGSYTSSVTIDAEAVSASAGTLTATLAWSNGTNKITMQITPTTSLTATTKYVRFTIVNNSEQGITLV